MAGRGSPGYALLVHVTRSARALGLILLAFTSACDPSAPSSEESPPKATAGPANEEPSVSGEQVSAEPGEGSDPSVLERLGAVPELVATPASHPPAADAGSCPTRKGRDKSLGILTSPRVPSKGETMRIWAADLESEAPIALRIERVGGSEDGQVVDLQTDAYAGVPATSIIRFTPEESGKYRVVAGRDGKGGACREFWVAKFPAKSEPPSSEREQVWKVRRNWDEAEEALYSAWVAQLFVGQPDEDLAWKSLHAITSDDERNLLFNDAGWEDKGEFALELTPDCADLPYFLRAYYSWKRRLPFGFHRCSRGKPGRGPSCFSSWGNNSIPDLKDSWVDGSEPYTGRDIMQRFFSRTLAWGVHTGNGRVALDNPENDLYPVELSRQSLRPGTVYADPYGHILVLTQFVPSKEGRPGVLFAVDGQPDASITRKRFWEGNFLWNPDPKLGGSGFKAFRPFDWMEVETSTLKDAELESLGLSLPARADAAVEGAEAGGSPATLPETMRLLRPLDDEALRKKAGYKNRSLEQGELSAEAFYDRMDAIISPRGREAVLALRGAIDALAEAARIRVTSVNNGVEYLAAKPAEIIEMPWGHNIFETTGAWENYSTPARDLRLLLAIDVVLDYEAKLKRDPKSFGLEASGVAAAASELAQVRDALLELPEYTITYTRSDGSPWKISLAELVARKAAFEMAYNPNDCVELRWGAPRGSEEASTCSRHAPEDQQKKMAAYQMWFQARQRPARGDLGPEIPGVPFPEEEED